MTARSRSCARERCREQSSQPPSESAPGATVAGVSELSPDYFSKHVSEVDPEIAEVLQNEARRQETTLEMIAAENFVPQAILDCQGSVLTNKYAEGYPGKRYYGGREHGELAEPPPNGRRKANIGGQAGQR